MHCAIETGGFEHELHAILGKDAEAECPLSVAVEAGGARGRSRRGAGRARRPRATRPTATGSTALADLGRGGRARRRGGRRSSSACSSSASRPGRIRAVYGPGGEQAALRLFRRLPAGAGLAETARSVSAALATLERPVARLVPDRGDRPGHVPDRARRRTAPRRRSGSTGAASSSPRSASDGSAQREAPLRRLRRPRGPERPRRRSRTRRAREGERPARLRRSGDRRRARGLARGRGAPRRAAAPPLPELRPRRPLPRRRRDRRHDRQPARLRRRRGARAALQRRRRSRALLLHPPRPAPRGSDHGRHLDRRRVARRSRRGFATRSPRSSGPSTRRWRVRLRELRPWAKSNLPTYEARRDYFAGLVREELG